MNTGKTRYEITHNIAGLIFLIVGTAWWLIPMILVHMGTHHEMPDGTLMSGHMHHGEMPEINHNDHGPTFLGLTEMTWMWYVMAVVHFLIHDCMKLCTGCKKKLND